MGPFLPPLILATLGVLALIALDQRIHLFRCDQFPSAAARAGAYLWLGAVVILLTYLVTASALRQPTQKELERLPFYSLFLLHAILVVFLAGWWLLTRRPPLGEFLNIRRQNRGEAVLGGLAIGLGGWMVTLALAAAIVLILRSAHLLPKDIKPSPMIPFLAGLPLWKKAAVVFSAMTVEEAFFRGWLQKRVGLIVSTALFAAAHSGLGQPLLLIGVALISLIIGFTFYRTKNLIPAVVVHGVFDAVQLFVIVPIVFRATGAGL
jgi:membrane protease YdiL (CAAX protease family)